MNMQEFMEALADHVSQAVSDTDYVYPLPTVNLQTPSITVSPAPEWGSWEGAAFCDPEVSFELLLVASTSSYPSSMGWFMGRINELKSAFDEDRTIGGRCDGISVTGWNQPQLVSTGSGEVLAVRVQLNPVVIY